MDAIQERMPFVLMKALRQHIIENMLKSNWKNGKASQMIGSLIWSHQGISVRGQRKEQMLQTKGYVAKTQRL